MTTTCMLNVYCQPTCVYLVVTVLSLEKYLQFERFHLYMCTNGKQNIQIQNKIDW